VREPAPSREGVRAVVFDWAGTTVDYGSAAPVEAFVRAFAAHGLDVSEADVRKSMGRAKREHLAAFLALPALAAQWIERHGREPDGGDVDRSMPSSSGSCCPSRSSAPTRCRGPSRRSPSFARGASGSARARATRAR
jgi:hypothetical protein